MAARKVKAKVIFGEVYISIADFKRTLFDDLKETNDPKLKEYLEKCIDVWSDYEEGIIDQARGS